MAKSRTPEEPEPVDPDQPVEPDQPAETSEARKQFLAGETRWRDYVEAEQTG